MEAAFTRCLAQLTLRSSGCLRSATPTTKRVPCRATRKTPRQTSNQRATFTSSSRTRQDGKPASTAQPQQQTPSDKPLSKDEEIAKQMDNLFARHSSKTAAPNRPRSNYDYYGDSSPDSPGSLFSRTGSTDPYSFLSPASTTKPPADVARNSALNSLLTSQFYLNTAPKRETPLRLKPSLGKTLDISEDRNFGLNRAFQTLENRINKGGNSVKMDLLKQRFHVRRGMQKKVYKRVRGREMFMQGFLGECARVRRMIKQGW